MSWKFSTSPLNKICPTCVADPDTSSSQPCKNSRSITCVTFSPPRSPWLSAFPPLPPLTAPPPPVPPREASRGRQAPLLPLFPPWPRRCRLPTTPIACLREISSPAPRHHERYIFQDTTGKMTVEIDDKLFAGRTVTPQTRVRLHGEIDLKRHGDREVDVDVLEILK